MAKEFNPTFAVSDKVILFNLHSAGLAKAKKFRPTETTLPMGKGDATGAGGKRKVTLCKESGLGEGLINSGCRNGIAEPEKTTFANKASVYEVGYVLKIGDKVSRTSIYNQPSVLKQIEEPIRKAVLDPIKSYMKVFAGNDAIQETDVQITHFANIRKDAGKRTDYSLLERVVDGKPEGFGYALCRIVYSVGLQKK